MAESTDTGDEHSKNNLSNQPKQPVNEGVSSAGPDIPTTEQATKNMEVHHHAHHDGKRDWRSYIREFLMLFLAVFCGFLAEYQLEHKIEKDREKQYINSMIEDLEADTSNLRISIESFTAQDNYFDTIFTHFQNLGTGYNQSLHTSLRGIIGYRDFFPTDKTMQQLKNSGGMRLIRNRKAADSIVLYDSKIKRYDKGMAVLDRVFEKMYDLHLEILDDAELEYSKKTFTVQQLEEGKRNYLLKNDKATLGKYYNQIKSYRLLRQIIMVRMEGLRTSATELILVLKKEYNLD